MKIEPRYAAALKRIRPISRSVKDFSMVVLLTAASTLAWAEPAAAASAYPSKPLLVVVPFPAITRAGADPLTSTAREFEIFCDPRSRSGAK